MLRSAFAISASSLLLVACAAEMDGQEELGVAPAQVASGDIELPQKCHAPRALDFRIGPVDSTSITLEFTESRDCFGQFNGIERRVGSSWVLVDEGDGVDTIVDPGRQPNTQYCYRSTARVDSVRVSGTDIRCATTTVLPPSAPPELNPLRSVTAGGLAIEFVDRSTNEDSFQLYRTTNGSDLLELFSVRTFDRSGVGMPYLANSSFELDDSTHCFLATAKNAGGTRSSVERCTVVKYTTVNPPSSAAQWSWHGADGDEQPDAHESGYVGHSDAGNAVNNDLRWGYEPDDHYNIEIIRRPQWSFSALVYGERVALKFGDKYLSYLQIFGQWRPFFGNTPVFQWRLMPASASNIGTEINTLGTRPDFAIFNVSLNKYWVYKSGSDGPVFQ